MAIEFNELIALLTNKSPLDKQLRESGSDVLPLLDHVLDSDPAEFGAHAIRALVALKHEDANELLVRQVHNREASVRRATAAAISDAGIDDQTARRIATALLFDGDDKVSIQVLRSIKRRKLAGLRREIDICCRNPEKPHVAQAAADLRDLPPPEGMAMPLMR